MENERCEIGLDFVDDDDQILDNTTNNNDNNNNNNNHHEKQQQNQDHDLFLTTNINGKNNAIQDFSRNGMCNHEQIDHQFLHIPTTSSSSLSSSGTPNQEQGPPAHDIFLAPQISSSHLLAGSKNNNNNKDPLLTIYGKGNGSSKNNNNNSGNGNGIGISSSGATATGTATATMNNNNKEQDRFLPIANVGRIMKKFIPGNGKISKDAKETVQECVSEFISFVTGEASDKCQREKRKTINGDDIIWAITTLGFEDYVNPLKHYLQKYRELEGEKLNNVPKPQRTTTTSSSNNNNNNNNGDHHHNHHLFHHQQQNPTMNMNNNYTHNMYHNHHPASTTLLPHPPQTTNSSYVQNDQPFPLPFSQTSNIQTRLPQHEHIDSVANW